MQKDDAARYVQSHIHHLQEKGLSLQMMHNFEVSLITCDALILLVLNKLWYKGWCTGTDECALSRRCASQPAWCALARALLQIRCRRSFLNESFVYLPVAYLVLVGHLPVV